MEDHGSVGTMDNQLGPRHLLETLIIGGMVKVTMGIDNTDTAQIVLGKCQQYLVRIATWIDDSCLSRPFTTKDITI
jgi:phage tail tube protein FII